MRNAERNQATSEYRMGIFPFIFSKSDWKRPTDSVQSSAMGLKIRN